MISGVSSNTYVPYVNTSPRISPLKTLSRALFLILSLPFANQAAAASLDDTKVKVFCALLGKRTGIDQLKEFHSTHITWRGPETISCSFKAPDDVKTIPTKGYKALVQNREGRYVPSHASYTVAELGEQGFYTFGFDDAIRINRTVLCGEKPFSCNKFVRTHQEHPEGTTLAEWKGWNLDQVFDYMNEIHQVEGEEGQNFEIHTNVEGIVPILNETHPQFAKLVKVEV